MMEEGSCQKWKGKKVFILLKSGRVYTGQVIHDDFVFLTLKDKFSKTVQVSFDDISVIQEESR